MPGPWRLDIWDAKLSVTGYFNLRRDARPLATLSHKQSHGRGMANFNLSYDVYFNVRRDARPLATQSIRDASGISWEISISDEMPGPWRRSNVVYHDEQGRQFQSQTRCQAPGDTP